MQTPLPARWEGRQLGPRPRPGRRRRTPYSPPGVARTDQWPSSPPAPLQLSRQRRLLGVPPGPSLQTPPGRGRGRPSPAHTRERTQGRGTRPDPQPPRAPKQWVQPPPPLAGPRIGAHVQGLAHSFPPHTRAECRGAGPGGSQRCGRQDGGAPTMSTSPSPQLRAGDPTAEGAVRGLVRAGTRPWGAMLGCWGPEATTRSSGGGGGRGPCRTRPRSLSPPGCVLWPGRTGAGQAG